MQDKAQVFPLVESDYVRTRLTHSNEVSSVARSLGNQLANWLVLKKELDEALWPAVGDIAATCGILHDLGNPPFGHAGEKAISEWCQKTANVERLLESKPQCAQDLLTWDGNPQTIRIVGKLQVLSDEWGLDFTCATFSAACKYVAASNKIDKTRHDWSKTGYFFSEEEVVQAVRQATGTGAARHPITLLVEASDDIVYATVDLEDAIKKRLLTWDRLEHSLRQKTKNCEHLKKALKLTKKKIGRSMRGFAREDALVQAFRTYAIGEAVPSVFKEFKKNYGSIIAGTYHDELVGACSAATLIKACKDIAHELVYQSDEILRIELMGRKVIQDLLSIFWEAASNYEAARKGEGFAGKVYNLLSSNYRHIFDLAVGNGKTKRRTPTKAPEEYYELQLVCDYIAGMTDTFAVTLHKKLTNG